MDFSIRRRAAPGSPGCSYLIELLMRGGRRAGRTKSADGCGGTLPLRSPQCGETVDPVDFKLKWRSTMPEEAGKILTLVVGAWIRRRESAGIRSR